MSIIILWKLDFGYKHDQCWFVGHIHNNRVCNNIHTHTLPVMIMIGAFNSYRTSNTLDLTNN